MQLWNTDEELFEPTLCKQKPLKRSSANGQILGILGLLGH